MSRYERGEMCSIHIEGTISRYSLTDKAPVLYTGLRGLSPRIGSIRRLRLVARTQLFQS